LTARLGLFRKEALCSYNVLVTAGVWVLKQETGKEERSQFLKTTKKGPADEGCFRVLGVGAVVVAANIPRSVTSFTIFFRPANPSVFKS
jgi:hypothetical protein